MIAASAHAWETLFAAYRWDADTGLFAVRWRNLHFLLSWLTRDPLGVPAGLNLYRYVNDRPMVFTDPYGLEDAPRPPCAKGFKKVPDPNFNPADHPPNGCGDFTGAIQGLVSFFGNDIDCPRCAANFKPDCDTHDKCYQSCMTSKATCDLQLYNALKATCGQANNYTCGGKPDMNYCKQLADWYWWAISTGIGIGVWIADQRTACICVPEPADD